MATRNEGVPEPRRMLFRIGINLGGRHPRRGPESTATAINVAGPARGHRRARAASASRAQVFDQVSRALKADFQALGPAQP